MRQTRQARQAFNLFNRLDPVRQTLMRATSGQCGEDTAHYSLLTVRAVATMDFPASLAHVEASEAALFCASILHRYGLLYANTRNSIPLLCRNHAPVAMLRYGILTLTPPVLT